MRSSDWSIILRTRPITPSTKQFVRKGGPNSMLVEAGSDRDTSPKLIKEPVYKLRLIGKEAAD